MTKFYQTLNQTPRSPKYGKHRRSSPPAYRDPIVGTDHGAGGSSTHFSWSVAGDPFTWLTAEEPKPPAIPNAGIRTGEIIGHRLWWIIREKDEDWLCSLVHRRLWTPDETVSGDTGKPVDGSWMFSKTIWGGVYSFASGNLLDPDIGDMTGALDTVTGALDTVQKNQMRGFIWVSMFGWEAALEAQAFVSGTVKMWGDVVEYERGYRAEFAKVASIDAIYGVGGQERLDALRAKYTQP